VLSVMIISLNVCSIYIVANLVCFCRFLQHDAMQCAVLLSAIVCHLSVCNIGGL